jgi:predicted O-methyltransferase YrrM
MNPPTPSQVLETIQHSPPALHLDEAGRAVNWGLDAATLSRLAAVLRDSWLTAETGAGVSTVLCGACVRRHYVVCPDPAEIARIRGWLAASAWPDRLMPLVASSDTALPGLAALLGGDKLDLALVDGAHRYPFPIVDWHYFSQVLRPDGILMVDDIQIPTVGALVDYLSQDEDWRLDEVTGKTAWFRKLREEVPVNDWAGQALNRRSTSGAPLPSFSKLWAQIGLKASHGLRRRLARLRR